MKHLALIAALTACTHHRKLVDPSELAGDAVEIEVTTAPGVKVDGRVMRGPSGYVVQTDHYGAVEFGQITRITEERNGIGALQGLGIGLLIGAGTGAVLGYADGDNVCQNDGLCFDAGTKALFGGLVFGTIGGLIGLAVGAVRGSRLVYEF